MDTGVIEYDGCNGLRKQRRSWAMDKKRAYRDAKRDYILEQAWYRSWWFKFFITCVLLGLGSRFFYVEA